MKAKFKKKVSKIGFIRNYEASSQDKPRSSERFKNVKSLSMAVAGVLASGLVMWWAYPKITQKALGRIPKISLFDICFVCISEFHVPHEI